MGVFIQNGEDMSRGAVIDPAERTVLFPATLPQGYKLLDPGSHEGVDGLLGVTEVTDVTIGADEH